MSNMYTAVTPAELRGVVEGNGVPSRLGQLKGETLRAGVLLASIAVGREYDPPRTAFEVMGDAMPILRDALGVELVPLIPESTV